MPDGLIPAIFGGAIIMIYVFTFWFLVRVLHRMGFTGWWSLLMFFWPLGLGLLAFKPWPAVDGKSI